MSCPDPCFRFAPGNSNTVHTNRLKISALLALCCPALFAAAPAQADERKVTPSLDLREEYSDNLFLTRDNQESDAITTVSPGLAYSQRSERGEFDLRARLDSVHYAERTDLDSTDKEVKARFGYSPSQLLRLGADGMWSRDSRLDRDLETTGLAYSASRRTRQTYNLNGSLQLSEKDMLQLDAGVSQDRYANPALSDVDGTTGRLAWNSDCSRYFTNLVGLVQINYGRYEYPSATVNTYTLGVGGEKKLSEVWSVNGWLGPSYTQTEYSSSFGGTTEDTGLSGSLGLERTWETASLSLTLSQSVAPDSGRNSTVNRSSAGAKYKKQLSEDLVLGLDLRYFRNDTDSDNPSLDLDEHNYQFMPNASYRLTEDIRLESSYQHMSIDDKTDGTSRRRNLVFVKIVFSHAFD